jgi:ABC-type uncharacterized transport system permease subunit
MRRRLYFTLPDVEHCKQLVAELRENGLTERHIHVVARSDISLDGLHKASALQKTELAYGLELGAVVGGVAGLLSGLLTITFPPAGIVIGFEVVLVMTVVGTGFGVVLSALIARDIPNHELEDFQVKIAEGQILLILNIPTKKIDEISLLIKASHPEAEIGQV